MINKLIIFFLLISTNLILAQERFVIDKVIAKVGGETILLSDVESQYAYALNQPDFEANPEAKCQILESIIGQKLIVHQAKLDSIQVGDSEIEAQLDFRVSSVLRQMNGDEEFFEEYYGMTIAEMRDNLRDDMISQLLAERMQGQILTEVEITPSEVKEFFNAIPTDSLPFLSSEVEIAEIVVAPEVNEIENLKALQKVLELRKDIMDEKEDFADLAKKFSDDPGSGAQGGELGFAERGSYVTEFEAVAYQLDEGEISEPVETQYGFHIIQMQERRGNKIRLRHILIKPQITSDDELLAKTKLDSIKVQISRGDITWESAVQKHSLKSAQSYNNGGRMQNPNTGKSIFQTGELPPEIYFSMEEMSVDGISDPLEYTNGFGETNYRLIKLQSRTKPHQVSLVEDYSKIQELARENKKNLYFSDWVNEKLLDTYIYVDQNYETCENVSRLIK